MSPCHGLTSKRFRSAIRRLVTASHRPRRVWPTCEPGLSLSASAKNPLWSGPFGPTLQRPSGGRKNHSRSSTTQGNFAGPGKTQLTPGSRFLAPGLASFSRGPRNGCKGTVWRASLRGQHVAKGINGPTLAHLLQKPVVTPRVPRLSQWPGSRSLRTARRAYSEAHLHKGSLRPGAAPLTQEVGPALRVWRASTGGLAIHATLPH
jgi:hypothetical protein